MARPDAKEFTQHLDAIARRGTSFHDVYSDWLALMCHALSKKEEQYMELITRYRDNHGPGDRNADHFAKATGAWFSIMQKDSQDYLGHVFEERITRGEKGQFFTPEPLAQLMTMLTHENVENAVPGEAVSDPACGSGRMLVSVAAINPRAYLHGTDLDLNCVRMTTLNLLCRNVDGAVIWGNSLTLKALGGYRLRHHWMGGVVEEMTSEEAEESLKLPLEVKAAQQAREEESDEEEQMDFGLF